MKFWNEPSAKLCGLTLFPLQFARILIVRFFLKQLLILCQILPILSPEKRPTAGRRPPPTISIQSILEWYRTSRVEKRRANQVIIHD